ncbi:VMAP-C domain-containing protein [Sphaerisporangium aureirubrum]|uniref:Uncharacterized protein n=1 Tax=Sphaerisporangium aureirubrum TaxID=1544736 RepID=A0ABW1NP98_9ACTN
MLVANVLTSIPEMRAETLLAVMTGKLSRHISVGESPLQQVFYFNIVRKCLEEDDVRRALISAVEDLASGSPKVNQIRRLLGLAADNLAEDDAQYIEGLLRECETEKLVALYHAAMGRTSFLYPAGLTTVLDVFHYLVDMNVDRDALAPHLRFVALLTSLMAMEAPVSSELLSALRRWALRKRDALRDDGAHVAATELDVLLHQPLPFQARDDFPICLIIEIEPLPAPHDERNIYRVTPWNQADQTRWAPVRGYDAFIPFPELGPHILGLVREAEESWGYGVRGPLVIEFLLAPELINLPVDQWTWQARTALQPRALGMDYEVVLRSGPLLRPRHKHGRWMNRWERLMTTEGEVHLMPLHEETDLQVIHGQLIATDRVVTSVLSGPPDREPGCSQLEAVIDAGVPAVLWCRDATVNGEFRSMLHDALLPTKLKSLPTSIKLLRASTMAGETQSQACRHVSLIWDDPNHRIPDIRPLGPSTI